MSDSRYIAETQGNCLGANLPDGTRLVVDAHETIRPSDICVIVLHEDRGAWSRFMRSAWAEAMGNDDAPNCMAKIYFARGVKDGREILLLGQLAPPCIGVVAAEEVAALHRVVGTAGEGSIEVAEREAFNLISWCAGHASPPINPQWRPAPQREAA